MATTYPPYVNAYGSIPKLFEEIKKASVPTKFTQDFIESILGLKSSSYRAMIPLLKRLEFIDQANVPTQAYKDFRDSAQSKSVMASQIRKAYDSLFAASEFAFKLSKTDLLSKLKTITGAADNDPALSAAGSTFIELVKLADFEADPKTHGKHKVTPVEISPNNSNPPTPPSGQKLGISYTINLNLPATTEVEVFNAIFKSLKEHILGNE
jgi:hypothetical protein